MLVTREADYAVRCVLYLTKEGNRVVSAKEISESMLVPKSFLAKILQRMSKRGIVTSTQGNGGGFQLSKPPGQVTLFEVIEAVQGPSVTSICAVDNRKCQLSKTCSVHPVWVELREKIDERLKAENFAKLVDKM